MKKIFLCLIVISIVVIFFGCKPDSDSVIIVSVTPSSDLVDGNSYDFTIVVQYVLASDNNGELTIGFDNSTSVNAFVALTASTMVVVKGSSEHTFNVNASAKDWQTEGDFQAYVYLAEYPHRTPFSPYASDKEILTF